jgi:TonB family protein
MSSTASAKDPRPSPPADLKKTLEQQVAAGFTPALALELVLNEIVVRAADATHASGAGIALVRDEQMIIRASTGFHAPDLGIPVDINDGLTGACFRTRQPQLSTDTDSDPRIDAAVSRSLGVRSMVVVPVFDSIEAESTRFQTQLLGLLEVFSPLANAFTIASQIVLEGFARDAAELYRASLGLSESATTKPIPIESTSPVPSISVPSVQSAELLSLETSLNTLTPIFSQTRSPRSGPRYDGWTIALGTVVILAAIGMGFLIQARTGWFGTPVAHPASVAANVSPVLPPPKEPVQERASQSPSASTHEKNANREKHAARARSETPDDVSDDLVVYDKDRVVFRMKPNRRGSISHAGDGAFPAVAAQNPAAAASENHSAAAGLSPIVPASSMRHIPPLSGIWLAPEEAQTRLLHRIEPQYPADALTAQKSGDVVLEVDVSEDGSVAGVRTLSGDPLLAAAAADAVRNWRYQPYRSHEHEKATPFQTDVTLTFSLPN